MEPPQSKLVMKHMVSMQVLYRGGGPHDSNRFMINVYYNSPVDLRTILKDTDPIDMHL